MYTAVFGLWPAPLPLVNGLLPPGLSLARQPITGPNQHPVVFLLGRQWDVNVRLGPLRARGCEYLEFLVAVPFVSHPASSGAEEGPFVFMPRLYLDNWPFVVAGWFYAYDKRRARVHDLPDAYRVESLFAGTPLVSASFQDRGAWGPLSAYPNASHVAPVFHLPFIGRLGFGPFVRSHLVFHMERARIAPLAAQIRLDRPLVAGLPAGTHSFPGIDESPFGAFRIEVPWTLGPPSWLAPFAAPSPRKRRIAVLGGGCGALSAAWALTNLPNASAEYEITVYQMGWRLGGKGASGRNGAAGNRIQEHGLHVWAGFYENAFKVMQECYGALRDQGGALPEWTDAFKKHSAVMLEELIDGSWRHWPLDFPEDDNVPGTGGEIPTPWQYLKLIVNWIVRQLERRSVEVDTRTEGGLADRMQTLLAKAPSPEKPLDVWPHIVPEAATPTGPHPSLRGFLAHDILKAASHFAAWLEEDVNVHFAEEHGSLLHLLGEAHDRLNSVAAGADLGDDVRRLLLLADIGLATTKGMLADGVLFHGFTAIDSIEWRAWLTKHGASPAAVSSAFVRGIYDYVFGFRGGRSDAMELEAGTATHGLLRLVLTYKGALFWEMQAGMGDIVFAPLYRALSTRGVKFAFFHKVENLSLAPGGRGIERIELTRQAEPKTPPYHPLIDVKGVPSWPAEPLYDRLVDGETLKGIDLESAWAQPVGVPIVIERGRDFDDVILGISLGAFQDVCGELIAANPRFAAMATNVKTVQTASMQLWLDPPASTLQAPDPPRIVSAYAELLNTWADMSFLLPRESWPEGSAPRFLAYFCSEFPDADSIPPYADHGFPRRERERYKAIAAEWLRSNTGHIWPGATAPDSRTALDLRLLHGEGTGDERLTSQYFRVNIDPTERYVLSLPGTSRFRLRAGESGFENLYLAGDWVRTSINAGCVEAAVMAGLDAASALSGAPIAIVGGL